MPIIGLTNQVAALPRIGILRKGAPKPERGPGRDLKHFRFQTEDQDAAEKFAHFYGTEPKLIRFFLPERTAEENFECWREEWVRSSLKHRCDGQTCVQSLTSSGDYTDEPLPCPYLELPDRKKGCKQVGRLQVVIPELKRLAYVVVLTTSIHDILELYANLRALEATRGDLRGIPLHLYRVPRKISVPDDNGKRSRVEKWLLHIEAQPRWVELQLAAAEEAALPKANIQQFALPPAPIADDGDEGDEREEGDEEIGEPVSTLQPISTATNGNSQSSSPTVSDQEKKIDQLLLGHCKKIKGEKNAQAFFNAKFSRMSAKEKKQEAVLLNLITLEQLAMDVQTSAPPDEFIEGEFTEEPSVPPPGRVSSAHLKILTDKLELVKASGVTEAEIRAELEITEEWSELPQEIAIDVIAKLSGMLGNLAKEKKGGKK